SAALCTVALLAAASVWAAGRDTPQLPPAAAGLIDFARDVEPIFARSCVGCHGPTKQKGGLRLDDGTAALKGGNSGPVIVPGDAAKSRLLAAVAGIDPDLKMPPEGKPALTAAEVGKLRAWVEQGAKWPKIATVQAARAKSSHWSFRAPVRPPVPAISNPQFQISNSIDAFI